ncbi:hypothetical protein K435DRAFT_880030 [Dendrothele bispora CBS 962.96]|uniref:Uncharacterized protein n=1 Tax=Dendrothele bispora (strain CBS 962.96) TaxID=1314807 RepID=A0A4S8KK80_DENBC|nr:hypothetical protein K435DRAFT_880030 [Dendrothele bispora CBS 962.96]
MSSSPFTATQQKTLKEDYLPDYLALDSDHARNKHLNVIIPQILEHENFHGKLGSEKTEKEWKVSITKFFKNRRQTQHQQQIRQEHKESVSTAANAAHDPVNCIKTMRKAVKLFQVLGHENVDGQSIFKSQNEEKIREHATTMSGNATANFKKALKELWDAEPDKASYESQAREYWNVPNNQTEFLIGASRLFSAVCEYKHLGKAELMLMYTFSREDGTCDSGCISGHSNPETDDFPDEHQEVYKTFFEVWNQYGQKYCKNPDPSPQQSRFTIPIDSTGRPRFPDLDFEKVTGEELREVMSVYFNALWLFAGRRGQPTYVNIKNSPESFFDGTRYKLPCFGNPRTQEFTRSMVIQLAEWLCEHSSMSAAEPFEFLSGQMQGRPDDTAAHVRTSGTESTEIETGTDDTAGHVRMGGIEGTEIEMGATTKGNAEASDIPADGARVTEEPGDSEGERVEPGTTEGPTGVVEPKEIEMGRVVRDDLDGTVIDTVGKEAIGDSETERGKINKVVEENLGGTAMDREPDGEAGTEREKDEMSNVNGADAGVVGKTRRQRRKPQPPQLEHASAGQTLRRSIWHTGAKGAKEQDTDPTPTLPSKRANLHEESKEEPPSKRPRNIGNGKKSKKRT